MVRMEEKMEERMEEMVEEMVEERVKERVEEVKAVLRTEVKDVKEKMEEKEVQLRKEMEAFSLMLEDKEAMLRKELASKEEVVRAVTQGLRDLPYLTLCAYQDSWTTPSSTITYDSFLTDFNNSDRPGGADGQLVLGTGVFTCLSAGIYSITYSGFAQLSPAERVQVYLYLNGVQVEESIWKAHTYSDTIGGQLQVPGSRHLVSVHLAVPHKLTSLLQMLPLQLGDTIELRTTGGTTGHLYKLVLCINLADQGLSARP